MTQPSATRTETGSTEQPRPDDGPWQRAGELFTAWQQGDQGALDELVRLLSPVLWHVVRAYGLAQDAAEDVLQATWLTLVRSGSQIRDPRAVGGWLTICARREAWRVARNESGYLATEDDALERRLGDEDSAEHTALVDESRAELWRAVGQLTARCQRLLRVIAFSDRPDYAGLALDLGMPMGSVGPTRGRCLEKLRHLLITRSTPVTSDQGARRV